VAFSPDGHLLAISGKDGLVRLCSASTGAPVDALDGWSPWLPRIAFSAHGKILAVAGCDHRVRVWDLDGLGDGLLGDR
jgi:WD40 repeat protein